MKILFTGGGTGGHFYPIIAVAQKLHAMFEEKKIANAELFFMSTDPYDEKLLSENNIQFKKISAGKLRTYFSFRNIADVFKTGYGVMRVLFQMFFLYPDVLFSKGGFASFPALVAARFFRIPVIIHESDSVPGRVNLWSGKFAEKIAVSYPEASLYFPEDKTALTGNPIREEILRPSGKDAFAELSLDPNMPVLFILGGSQGSRNINEHLITLAPRLIEKYQIIHVAGELNAVDTELMVRGLIAQSPNKNRYRVYAYLDGTTMKYAAEAATLVVSRAGSGIFEIAHWGIPAILIPIANSNGDHQRANAFAYARAGGATVIEEANLTTNILLSEIDRLIADKKKLSEMKSAARAFSKSDGAYQIAEQILSILIRHRVLK